MKIFKSRNVTLNNQKKILFVLIFMSLSIGLWYNFRQIWLTDIGLTVSEISKLISLGMFGSCFLAIIISLFSTKIRIKEVLTVTFSISIISMLGLLLSYNNINKPLIETFVLITIVTENLFWIGIYPLFTTVKKSGQIYEKKNIYQNLFKDIGILTGGLIIGKTIGKIVLNANFCLLISIISSLISLYFLLIIRYEKDVENEIETKDFISGFKKIFKNKILILFFVYSFFVNVAWDIIVGLQLLLFVEGFNITESFSSYIILTLGMVATILAILSAKKFKFKHNFTVCFIKYGVRTILCVLTFITKSEIMAIITFSAVIITSRFGSNNTDGAYLNMADDDLQLMVSNIKFFCVCLGETAGIFLAGYLFKHGISTLFLASGIFYFITTIICYILSKSYEKTKEYKNLQN